MAAAARFVLYLVCVCLAIGVTAMAWHPELVVPLVPVINHPIDGSVIRLGGMGLVALIWLCLFILVYARLRRYRYRRELSYTNEQGKVSLSLVAIEDALTRAIESEIGVRKVECRVYEDRLRRYVVVDCALVPWEQNDVSAINRECQQILHRRFTELLPHNPVRINIKIHRLSHRASSYVGPETRRRSQTATVLTPGLALTDGQIDRHAAEELLSKSRKATREVPLPADYQDRDFVPAVEPPPEEKPVPRLPTTSELKKLEEEERRQQGEG